MCVYREGGGEREKYYQNITLTHTYIQKQIGRIKQVLQQVYLNKENVDDELVESIRYPSLHPNAAEVFYRVVTRTSTAGALATVNKLLAMLEVCV